MLVFKLNHVSKGGLWSKNPQRRKYPKKIGFVVSCVRSDTEARFLVLSSTVLITVWFKNVNRAQVINSSLPEMEQYWKHRDTTDFESFCFNLMSAFGYLGFMDNPTLGQITACRQRIAWTNNDKLWWHRSLGRGELMMTDFIRILK